MPEIAPTTKNIVGVVRLKGRQGCTAEYLAQTCQGTPQAILKALQLQMQAGIIESFEWPSEPGILRYRIREGK